jgi:asparagine synthase (glutamine-hydrolysing)
VSGFAGIIRLEPGVDSEQADRSAIERMAQAIAFRGPDALQETHQPGASFALSLLKTGPAPQSDSQPVTIDGTVWLVGDVRLDRRNNLIDGLAQYGQDVRPGVTDEEIVLMAWKWWRKKEVRQVFFEQIYGDFSFVLWEPARQKLHCFRDVMGVRPFYYCLKDGAFSFSNTLEALHHAPGFSGELDREYIGDFLLVGWCPRPEHSVYKSVRRLPAGHCLTFSAQGFKLERFQQLPVEEPMFLKREEEYVETYRDLLEKAVADRLPQGSTAIFLSGGMDSCSLAATVCALRKKVGAQNDLHGITADLRPLFDDEEGEWATRVAEHLGISFELNHSGNCTPFLGFADGESRSPEPLSDPYWATHKHLCRQGAAKARVVLVGYGGDNVLNNETWPYFRYLFRRGRLGRALTLFASYTLTRRRLPPLRAGLRSRFQRWFGLAKAERKFPPWLAPDFERKLRLRDRWSELDREPVRIHSVHPIGHGSLTDPYWPLALDLEDASYSGVPLEMRSPLFDYRLLRFLLRLPALPWCAEKEIMRRAMRGALPGAVLERPKTPVAEEVLTLHVRKGNWHPAEVRRLARISGEFVEWPEFSRHAQQQYGSSLWNYVPAIALNLWLNQIEKGLRIE